jgi:beta-galactosidase/beta-glucuronidase
MAETSSNPQVPQNKDAEDFYRYPRKQLRRKDWMTLNGEWDFAFDNEATWRQPTQVIWDRKITVPFAPESTKSGIGDTGYHLRCWYRKTFKITHQAPRFMIHFGAVDYEAHVWLNGQYLGTHSGGHTPFSFEITPCMLTQEDGENTLIVCANDDPLDLAKPRGKQDWKLEPHSIWYPRTSGIWQSVWVEPLPETFIDRLVWAPLLERWEMGIEAHVNGIRDDSQEIRVILSVDDRVLAEDRYKVVHQEIHRKIAFSDPGIDDFRNELLWSPEKPTLINAVLELWSGDRLLDRVESYTALRSVALQRDRFMLNGRPYYMRLALDQGYWEDSLMTPPTTLSLKQDIELAKAAGFNGVRKHQKIEDPDFLFWADVLGLLVWEEMPSAYRFTHESVERITREWIEVIDRDVNHPCVVVWVPFNESWGVPDLADKAAHQTCVQALYYLTRTLDPTRPVIGNDGWESTATDILGIHDYDDQPERLIRKYENHGSRLEDILYKNRPGGRIITAEGHPHTGQPLMLTEFGGIACIQAGDRRKDWGYSVCKSPDEFQKRYEELMQAVHRLDLFCGFCYTQFTDTFQEANGLFTMDRKPKFDLEKMREATRGHDPMRGERLSVPEPTPTIGLSI